MEKPKAKKPNTIQMKYPAPYSHSWASPQNERPEKPKRKKAKKIAPTSQNNLFPGCCRLSNPKPLLSSNPYAPHLKYGIFPQQPPKTRSISATVNSADRRNMEELAENKAETKRPKKAELSDTPLFVIRPIDKRHRRQLSLSETLHFDIKPRRYAAFPV